MATAVARQRGQVALDRFQGPARGLQVDVIEARAALSQGEHRHRCFIELRLKPTTRARPQPPPRALPLTRASSRPAAGDPGANDNASAVLPHAVGPVRMKALANLDIRTIVTGPHAARVLGDSSMYRGKICFHSVGRRGVAT